MLSVGSIVEGAFAQLGKRPVSLLVWGLIHLLLFGTMMFAMRGFFLAFTDFTPTPGVQPSPEALTRIFAAMAPLQGMNLVVWIATIVLWNAALRSVMRPDESAFAYLRLGMDELRVFGLSILIWLIFAFGFGVAMVVLVIACTTIYQSGNHGVAVLVGVVGGIAVFCVAILAMVRLSIAGALTIYRRKIVIGEAWRLTAGHFWTMFLGYFVVVLLLWVVQSVLSAFTVWPMMMAMMQTIPMRGQPIDPEASRHAMQAMMTQMTTPGLAMALLAIGIAIIGALQLGLIGGAIGTAARQLVSDDGEDVEAMFA